MSRSSSLLLLLLLQDAPDAVKRVLPEDATIERATRAVDVERVQKIMGGGEVARAITVYTARGVHPGSSRENPNWTATVVKIETPLGPAELGVSALLEEDMVGRVRISGVAPEKVPAEFLRQFGGFEYVSSSLLAPPSALEDVRKRAAAAKDEEGKTLQALLTVRSSMSQVSPTNMVIVERIQKKEKKTSEAEALVKLFEDAAKAADGLTFLKEDLRKRFRDLANASAGHARTLVSALRAGEFQRADQAQQTLSSSCGACHGSYIRLLRPERAKRSIGDGYFRVGFDVLAEPGADPKLQEAIAAGVRRALVLLSQSR